MGSEVTRRQADVCGMVRVDVALEEGGVDVAVEPVGPVVLDVRFQVLSDRRGGTSGQERP